MNVQLAMVIQRWRLIALLVLSCTLPVAFSPTAFGAEAGMDMWSCAAMGQRRPVLYLADHGARSYIKFQGQRISATHRLDDATHEWDFGANAVVLGSDGVAKYFQGSGRSAPAGTFKCKQVNS